MAAQYLEAGGFRNALPDNFRFELLKECHSEAIVRWRNAPENRDAFFSVRPLTVADQVRFLETYETRDRIDFVLVDGERSKPIGVFTLKELHTAPELGKLLGEREYRGRGLGLSATRAMLDFGFDWLGLPEVVAQTQKVNEPNIHLNGRLGFVVDTEFDSGAITYLRMRLTRDEFSKLAT